MLKRELKVNKKGLILWTSILVFIFLLVFLVYPTITSGENVKSLNEMMKAFPEELLKAFNMDVASFTSVFGWFKTEGNICLLLIGALYSSYIGSSILVKEESDKTIDYLYSKPISKTKIVKDKMLTGIINILILVLVVTMFNLWGMYFSNDLEIKPFLLLSLSPLIIFYIFFFLSMFISTFFTKTRKTIGISFGVVFLSYFIQVIGSISDSVFFIKNFSLFELISSRYIILNNSLNYIGLLIGIAIIFVLIFITLKKYNKKEYL